MKQNRLKKSIEMGILSLEEIKERMAELKEEASELELKISLSYEPTNDLNFGEIKKLARGIKSRLKSSKSGDQYDAIRQIVTGITVDYPWITLKVNFVNIQEEYKINYWPEPVVPADLSSLNVDEVRKIAGSIRRYTNDQSRTWRDEIISRIDCEEYIYAYQRKKEQIRNNG